MMKELILKYDTTMNGSFTASMTAVCVNLSCELEKETKDTFQGAGGRNFETNICRLVVDAKLSYINFYSGTAGDANYVFLQKWANAPFKRIQYIPSSTYPSINGFSDFNSTNTININVDDSSTDWFSNKDFRNINLVMKSESRYIIT